MANFAPPIAPNKPQRSMFPLSAFDIVEIVTLLVGIFCLSALKKSPLIWLVGLLFIVVTAELAGRYFRKVLHQPNAWIFNLSTCIEFLVYGLLFYRCFTFPAFKKIALGFLYFFPIAAAVNIIFIQGFFNFHSYTMSIGSLFMILFCCCFFYELLYQKEKINLLAMPLFWIATGILFFYTGDLLYNLFFNYMVANNLNYKALFAAINNNLIILLYFCFTVAFLCKRLDIKSS
jgi:hypothetical protein